MGEAGIGPKIRAVHWCEQDGGVVVMIVGDLMSKGDLAHFSLSQAVTENHVAQIETKIRKMHRMGYLHNDIHSRNVLVNDDGHGGLEFFISDFGFAEKDDDADKRRREIARVRAMASIATRDKLRGLLYNMVADGRIRLKIKFDQSATHTNASPWIDTNLYT